MPPRSSPSPAFVTALGVEFEFPRAAWWDRERELVGDAYERFMAAMVAASPRPARPSARRGPALVIVYHDALTIFERKARAQPTVRDPLSLLLALLDDLAEGWFTGPTIARAQRHWVIGARRSVLLVKHELAGTTLEGWNKERIAPRGHAIRSPQGIKRELRVRVPKGEFPLAALRTPEGWADLSALACIARVFSEAEWFAERGEVRLGRCEHGPCGAWFDIPSMGVAKRRFCSTRCRVAALRARA